MGFIWLTWINYWANNADKFLEQMRGVGIMKDDRRRPKEWRGAFNLIGLTDQGEIQSRAGNGASGWNGQTEQGNWKDRYRYPGQAGDREGFRERTLWTWKKATRIVFKLSPQYPNDIQNFISKRNEITEAILTAFSKEKNITLAWGGFMRSLLARPR